MLEKSFGLVFFLKKTKFSKGTERLLYGRITINGMIAGIRVPIEL
jgi:hypothetical protein